MLHHVVSVAQPPHEGTLRLAEAAGGNGTVDPIRYSWRSDPTRRDEARLLIALLCIFSASMTMFSDDRQLHMELVGRRNYIEH